MTYFISKHQMENRENKLNDILYHFHSNGQWLQCSTTSTNAIDQPGDNGPCHYFASKVNLTNHRPGEFASNESSYAISLS